VQHPGHRREVQAELVRRQRPTYQDMTDRDLLAIYTYLRAIPHAEPGTGQ